MIKIFINTIVTIVLATGTIQGGASYGEYCDKESFHCDFYGHYQSQKYDYDIDFLAVVIVSAINALAWVSRLSAFYNRLYICVSYTGSFTCS